MKTPEYTCYYCEPCGLEFCTTESHTRYCPDCKSDNIYISELTDYINEEDFMPEYEHKCTDEQCAHEWEATYSIKVDPPKICPKCGKETAKRLISLGGKGVVELTGQDLTDKLKSDANKLKRDAAKSEKIYSNLLGEGKYHEMQTSMDRRGK